MMDGPEATMMAVLTRPPCPLALQWAAPESSSQGRICLARLTYHGMTEGSSLQENDTECRRNEGVRNSPFSDNRYRNNLFR